jgi:tRNA (adenine22-N1)-methyltransferase
MKKLVLPVLNNRLSLIVDKVTPCSVAADIGCDHAYVAIHLYHKGLVETIYASDIKPGPIKTAKKNIEKYQCQKYIKTVLADGLDGVINKGVETYIIAGMGGEMIVEILRQHRDKFSDDNIFILQPMSSIEDLRKYLYHHQFMITDEQLCMDGNKLYHVMVVRLGNSKSADDVHYYIGERLVLRKDPLLEELLQRRIKEHEGILKGLERTNDRTKLSAISDRIQKMKQIRGETLCQK